MKPKRTAGVLLALLLLLGSVGIPETFAASGDPALRFELSTEAATDGLKAGDQIPVLVTMERDDGSADACELASIMLDISYDNQLFEVSQLTSCGQKRPDGQSWIGSWTCSTIPAGDAGRRVRVLYLNMSGLMSNPPKLDRVSGKLSVASFILTAKQDAPGVESAVSFSFVENGDAKGDESPSVTGGPLALRFAGASGGGDAGGSGGEGSGGSSGSGGQTDGSGSGSGSGSGGSGSDGTSGSGSSSGGGHGGQGGSSGSGSQTGQGGQSQGSQGGQGSQTGTGGSSQGTAGGVNGGAAFSELTDVPADHWAAQYIESLVTKGILSGNETKQFQPDRPVTRAEFCQMIAASFGYEAKSEEAVFRDVTQQDWYRNPVMALYEAGIVSGTGDGLFGADDTLSRQDMALILYRVQKDRSLNCPVVREYGTFTDQNLVEDYARQAMTELYCTGLISGTGDGRLSPAEESTRAQAATVLYKMLEEGERR